MNSEKLKIGLLTFIFIIISPWFLVLLLNYPSFSHQKTELVRPLIYTDEINTLQGQASKQNIGTFGKLIVNKYTTYFRFFSQRYLESFDPKFLFFQGDLDIRRSTHSAGPIYLSFLPMSIVFLNYLFKNLREKICRLLIGLFFISPTPSAFFLVHYDTFLKLPLILLLTYFASRGFFIIVQKNQKWAVLLVLFLVFEYLRFYHDFYLHYPRLYEWLIEGIKLGPKV